MNKGHQLGTLNRIQLLLGNDKLVERTETHAELAAERAASQKKEQKTEPYHINDRCLPLKTCQL